jgi:hypothetical protein
MGNEKLYDDLCVSTYLWAPLYLKYIAKVGFSKPSASSMPPIVDFTMRVERDTECVIPRRVIHESDEDDAGNNYDN